MRPLRLLVSFTHLNIRPDTNKGQGTKDRGLQAAYVAPQISYLIQVSDFMVRIAKCIVCHIVDFLCRASDFRIQSSDLICHNSDAGLRASDIKKFNPLVYKKYWLVHRIPNNFLSSDSNPFGSWISCS